MPWKIAQKVGGYAKRTLVDSSKSISWLITFSFIYVPMTDGAGETASPIRAIEAFIMSLVNDTEGTLLFQFCNLLPTELSVKRRKSIRVL